jgi:hypothetical protein
MVTPTTLAKFPTVVMAKRYVALPGLARAAGAGATRDRGGNVNLTCLDNRG